jgi:glutamate-ammonia-ligase adenylyltransferase
VIALGKLGGQELNYSSDIDLMFVYSANGETTGPDSITNKEFFKKVANQYTELLSTYTTDGLCYRVDLRLRPDGRLGEVCISLEGAERYYQERARDWEKQMLIKARVCAGDWQLGRELLDFVEPLIYSSSLDFRAVEAISEARERISEKLAAKRAHAGLDIKLAPGGIRDIEFLVQCLQRLHGGREPWVRHGGTLFALSRLHDKDLLSASEYARLASAYQFLRHLEHRLQFYDDRQTHTLPTNPEELEVIARKMPPESGAEFAAESLEVRLEEHLTNVRELYGRVIQAQKPIYYTPVEGPPAPPWLSPEAELPVARAEQSNALPGRARAAIGRHAGAPERCTAEGALRTFSRENVLQPGVAAAPRRRCRAGRAGGGYFRAQPVFRRSASAASRDAGRAGSRRRTPDGAIEDSASLRSLLPPEDVSDPERQPSGAGADLRNAGAHFGSGRSVIAAAYRIALREAPQPAKAPATCRRGR